MIWLTQCFEKIKLLHFQTLFYFEFEIEKFFYQLIYRQKLYSSVLTLNSNSKTVITLKKDPKIDKEIENLV